MHNKLIKLNCIICGKRFSDYISNRKKFCSCNCYYKFLIGKPSWNKGIKGFRKGHITTKETREKISKILKGKYKGVCFNTGRTHFKKEHKTHLGKKHSKEAKRKMSIAKLGKKYSEEVRRHMSLSRSGKKCPFWKGGITDLRNRIKKLIENRFWREQIFKRDNYTCVECYKKGGDLEAHHIKLFSTILKEFLQEYNQFSPIEDKEILERIAINYRPFWDIDNGKTLCKECHNETKEGRTRKNTLTDAERAEERRNN